MCVKKTTLLQEVILELCERKKSEQFTSHLFFFTYLWEFNFIYCTNIPVRCWLNENQHVFVKGFGMGLAPDVGHLVMQVYFTILPVTVFSITEKKL